MQQLRSRWVGCLLVAVGSVGSAPLFASTPLPGSAPRLASAALSAVPLPPATATSTDTILIRLGPGAAMVTQRIPVLDRVVEAHAIRLEGQWLHIERAAAEKPLSGQGFDRLPGAYHLRLTGEAPVELRYRVAGRLDRIPLFVSSPEARLAAGPVTLRVELARESSARLDLGTSFPRFGRSSDGALIATLSSTPSFVRLDAAGRLSFARVADLAVVILILIAAGWAWRTARASEVLAGPGRPA